MRTLLLAAALLVAGTTGALAADTEAAGRYTLTPSANGYIRLDTQTGQVSECTGDRAALICHSTADERQALQGEIDRLTTENETLKKQLADQAAAPSLQSSQDPQGQVTIPSDKDVDKAFNFLERMIKRFKGLIEELRKEPTETQPL